MTAYRFMYQRKGERDWTPAYVLSLPADGVLGHLVVLCLKDKNIQWQAEPYREIAGGRPGGGKAGQKS